MYKFEKKIYDALKNLNFDSTSESQNIKKKITMGIQNQDLSFSQENEEIIDAQNQDINNT